MSKVHDAMRALEHDGKLEAESGPNQGNLVCALIEELADEVPDDPSLESVRADLVAVCRAYEVSKKNDLALRFYLAMRSLLREHAQLEQRFKRAEKKNRGAESASVENGHPDPQGQPEAEVQQATA